MSVHPVRLPGATKDALLPSDCFFVPVAAEIAGIGYDFGDPVRVRVQSRDPETRVVELLFRADQRHVVGAGTLAEIARLQPAAAPVPGAGARYRLVLERVS